MILVKAIPLEYVYTHFIIPLDPQDVHYIKAKDLLNRPPIVIASLEVYSCKRIGSFDYHHLSLARS